MGRAFVSKIPGEWWWGTKVGLPLGRAATGKNWQRAQADSVSQQPENTMAESTAKCSSGEHLQIRSGWQWEEKGIRGKGRN